MSTLQVPGGVVHDLPADLRTALVADGAVLETWKDITPLARNEFICWVEDAKQEKTRERRIRRTQEELEDGMRRSCCWPGGGHRERNGRYLYAGTPASRSCTNRTTIAPSPTAVAQRL